jgi:hypothetical protein
MESITDLSHWATAVFTVEKLPWHSTYRKLDACKFYSEQADGIKMSLTLPPCPLSGFFHDKEWSSSLEVGRGAYTSSR